MIPLASGIEPKLIFVVVAAIVGVINWLIEKKKKDREAADGSTQPPARPQQPIAQGGTDEQERLRRFMESLGVPQPPQPPQPKRPQPAPGPAAVRPRQQPQISRQVAQPIEQRMKSPKPVAKARAKAMAKPFPVREPEEMHRAGRIEEAASSIEKISGEFSAMNVHVAMEPVKPLDSSAHLASGAAGTTSVTERDINPLVASVRRLLQKPADLRGVFVAMEILGPPRGLQS